MLERGHRNVISGTARQVGSRLDILPSNRVLTDNGGQVRNDPGEPENPGKRLGAGTFQVFNPTVWY